MITASSLLRLMNCPGSAVLPRAENASPWADAGHDEHEELARQVATGDLPDDIARFVPANARSEVAFAYDVATDVGRVLGENLGRAYPKLGPFEICGATDVVGTERDAVVIGDFKTGFADVEPAATNPQLAFYGLAAARAMGKDTAILRIIYTNSGRSVDEATLGPLELADFSNKLVEVHRRVAAAQATRSAGSVVETREGLWCKHCASKASCPSKNALLVQVAESGLAVIGDVAMTPARAATAYQQVARLEQLVKDARKRLEQYVDDNGPIDLGEGRMFGRFHRKGNEELDGAIAVQAIRDIVGEQSKEFEAIAVERSTTKAAIKRAASALVAKGANKVADKVVARIRELGGSTTKAASRPLGEYTAKDEPGRSAIDVDAVNALMEVSA